MSHETCAGCRYFVFLPNTGGQGECRRHAPQLRLAPDGGHEIDLEGVWPCIADFSWCGEFELHSSLTGRQPLLADYDYEDDEDD